MAIANKCISVRFVCCVTVVIFGALVCHVTAAGDSDLIRDEASSANSSALQNEDSKIFTRYAWMMGLFDHHDWSRKHYRAVSDNCSNHMDMYLNALRGGKQWAARMSDASGRYNGQFFFGNDLWLGSGSFCSEMQLEYDALIKEKQRIHVHNHQTPPYPIAFKIGRINLLISELMAQARLVLVGECLPASCTSDDVTLILTNSAADVLTKGNGETAVGVDAKGVVVYNSTVQLKILNVRSVPGPYSLWNDVAFYIIIGIAIAAGCLMIVASAYEYYINYFNNNIAKMKDDEIECQNNNYTHIQENSSGNTNESNQQSNGNNLNPTSNQNGGSAVHTNGVNAEKNKANVKKLGGGIFSQILLSFSIFSNTDKIMKTEESTKDAITCIHGLRFLSLLWVIMVHTYLTVFNIADNKTLRIITERNFFYQTVGNASYSVDTFFFISGFLLTFLYLKSMDAKRIAKTKRSQQSENQSDPQRKQPNIQKDQYAFMNQMAPQSTTPIGQQPAVANGGNDDAQQNSNTIFTRRTCTKEVKESVSEFSLLLFYRIVRLTPAYLFVIGFDGLVAKYGQNNSVFDPLVTDHVTCDKYWWRNILYMNNFFPNVEMCMLWTWYMANDTQFYIVGLTLLILSKRYFKFSVITLFILMISSWFVTGYISLANNYRAKIQEPFALFDELYDKPWSRIGPYLIGMITGWYVHRTRGRINMPWWITIACWVCTSGIMGSLIYGMKDGRLEYWPTAFYVSIGHTAWGVAVSWIVLFCLSPQGSILNKALSYRGMLPLSRLTYCAYLLHPTIMVMYAYQLDGPFHLHNGIVLIVYAGTAVMSFLLSFVISLAFEAPVVRLLKISSRK